MGVTAMLDQIGKSPPRGIQVFRWPIRARPPPRRQTVPAAGHSGGRPARASPRRDVAAAGSMAPRPACRFGLFRFVPIRSGSRMAPAAPGGPRPVRAARRFRSAVRRACPSGTRSPTPYRLTCRPALPDRGRVFLRGFFRCSSGVLPGLSASAGALVITPRPGSPRRKETPAGRQPAAWEAGDGGPALTDMTCGTLDGGTFRRWAAGRLRSKAAATGHHHPTDPASGWFSATTSKRPGGSLRNAAPASASARLSKGPCSSPVSRSTTVYSGSQAGIPRKWADRV